ncbi:MAG: hypothetical protein WBC97_10115 [Gemmatimonadales bacterium]
MSDRPSVDLPTERAVAPALPASRRPWIVPSVEALPKLTELTLLSPIGGGGGIGGSTVFGLLLAAGLLFGVGACSDDIVRPSTPSRPAAAVQTITCRADVRAGSISCAGPESTLGPVTLGGQGTRVLLRSSNVAYDSVTHIFSADVTLENLLAQTLIGATDVFFESGPTVTAGTGLVTVANPTGVNTFDHPSQPYFQYADSIRFDQVSPPLNWQWSVPATVTSFDFTVLVYAQVQDAQGVLFWSEVPQFHSDSLIDIAVNSSTDAMAVGLFGEVLHKVGSAWSEPPVQHSGEWAGIAAIGGGKYVGATTTGNVLLFDGQVWKLVRNAGFTIAGVTAYAANRIAIGGDSGGSPHISWLGDNGWFSISVGGSTPFSFLTSDGTDQGVAANAGGSVYRFNFNSPTPSGSSGSPITAMYGAVSTNDFGYAVFSGGGGILDFGTSAQIYSGGFDTTVDAIDFGSGGPNWWAAVRSITTDSSVLMSWTGGTWSDRATLPAQVTRIKQDSSGGLYLLSSDGIRRWNGSSIVDELVTSAADYPTALAAAGSRAAVGTVEGNVRRYVSGSWVTSDPDGAATDSIVGIQMAGGDTILAAEGKKVDLYDGASWSMAVDVGSIPIAGFWAANGSQLVVFLSGTSSVYRMTSLNDYTHNTSDPGGGTPVQLTAAWGSSIDDFWLVGNSGQVVWYNGTGYVNESPGPSNNLDAVAGTSSSNVWVGGTNGYIAHWNGSGWTDCSLPTTETVTSLWISADGTVYAGTPFAADTLQNLVCGVRVPTIPNGGGTVRALQGSSSNQLWALVGNSVFEGQR